MFSSADSKLSLFMQNFLPEREPSVPLVLVNVKLEAPSKDSPFIDFLSVEKAERIVREFGASGVSRESDFEKDFENIDSLVEKNNVKSQKTSFFFNIKERFLKDFSDTKSPAEYNPYLSKQRRHLVYKKNDGYYADLTFFRVLQSLKLPEIQITNSSINLGKIEIPRAEDGSVVLKFPKKSWHEFKSIQADELYDFSELEMNFRSCLEIISQRGLFGELNSENPLPLFDEALECQDDFGKSISLKNKFYVLMADYLSGKQERILLEAAADEEESSFIKDSFGLCRNLFSELETRRAKLREQLAGSFCLLVADYGLKTDFIPSPSEKHFPENLVPYVIANMIFSADFVDLLHPFFSFAVALVLCLIFVLVAYRIKRNLIMLFLSIILLLLSVSAFVFLFLYFRIFAGLAVPLSSLVLLSLILNIKCRKKNASDRNFFAAHFQQGISESSLKKIISAPADFALDGHKSDATILALSIAGFRDIKKLFNENQLCAFLNHYFDKITLLILEGGGIVESYRNDRILSIFGSPVPLEDHCIKAVKTAFEIKKIDLALNQEISLYSASPKPDGMSDDLYTAFFILNHNEKKILSRVGIYSAEISAGCIGSSAGKSFRILDDSWKYAFRVKKAGSQCDASGIFVNGSASDYIRDFYILRSIPLKFVKPEETSDLYEILGSRDDDDDKLWNYANFWNQAVALLEKGESEKALAVFEKLSEGRPNDKVARYFIKFLSEVK